MVARRGFDWPSHIQESRDLRQRARDREIARAQAKQAARDKAQRLQADTEVLLATGLNGQPVAPTDRAERAKFLRRPFRRSATVGGL